MDFVTSNPFVHAFLVTLHRTIYNRIPCSLGQFLGLVSHRLRQNLDIRKITVSYQLSDFIETSHRNYMHCSSSSFIFFPFHEEGARIMVGTTVFPSITVIMKELLVATTEFEHAMLRFRWQYNFTT